jgi:cell wall assembly regulator SMI1
MRLQRENRGTDYSTVSRFEKKIGFILPNDFKDFLYEFNGGLTEEGSDVFFINDRKKNSMIDKFFGLDLKPSSNIEYLLDYYSDRFPKGIIPIGEDPGGNYICLNVNEGKDYGKVYFYDHEVDNEDGQGNATWANLTLIADTFTEFLEKLH